MTGRNAETRGESDKARAAARMTELRGAIERHRRLYFGQNQPEVSDSEYDRLEAELLSLEREHPELVTPDSPTRLVGERPTGTFRTVAHAAPMLSLDNSYSKDEVREFDARLRRLLG